MKDQKPKVAFFTNIAPHYREKLWMKFIKELDVEMDFYYGYLPRQSIKPINFQTKFWIKHKSKLHILKNITYYNRLIFQRHIFRYFIGKKWDGVILLGHASLISNWFIIALAKFKGIKIIIWGHGIYGRENRLKKKITLKFLKLADEVILYGDRSKRILMHHGFTERKLKVIYNSINYDLTLEKRESSLVKNYYADFFNNSNKTIVYIGRLTKYKKLGILIEALHTLKLKGKNYNLMLIGDGTERLELEKMTNKLKINACFFGPCYSEEQISQLLSNADLCVSPGNVGLTAVHAMSYGTPVCTHDNFSTQMPEFEIIKPNKTGCFYSLDKNNLAETIVDWFENNQNREEIRKECYNIIDKYYNPDYQVKVMKEALKAINQN